MGKRLILILALAFVVGITVAAFAEVQNVKVSGDITAIGATRQLQLNKIGGYQAATDRSKFMASITRVRIDADLTDNVMTTVRLLNERYWGAENENVAFDTGSTIDIDLAYATMKEFLYSPLTLMIGRQELHFGNDMIVGDPDTNNVANASGSAFGANGDPDLSARKAFDAIRATLNYDPLMIDMVVSKVSEGTLNKEDDVTLYGVNATYNLTKKTNVQGYWFLRDRQSKNAVVATTVNKTDSVHAIGALVKSVPMDNLSVSAEAAMQLGKATRQVADGSPIANFTNKAPERKAFALELGGTLAMPKVSMTPTLSVLYAFFSGQKGDVNKKVTAWDPMFENQGYGNISGVLFNQSNAHILGGIVTAKPMDDVTLKGEYYAYWWDKKYANGQTINDNRGEALLMKDKKFAGQELDLTATYDYTEDVQLSLMTGLFFPGTAFDKGNRNIANEVIGQMKVTF